MNVNVYREFCYRWNCPCGQVNRLGVTPSVFRHPIKLQCPACSSEHTIAKVIYDNGAVLQVEERK